MSEAAAYLNAKEAARYLRCSLGTIRGRTRINAIPHRKMAGTRLVLYPIADLDAWVNGATLEVETSRDGAKIVRPVQA